MLIGDVSYQNWRASSTVSGSTRRATRAFEQWSSREQRPSKCRHVLRLTHTRRKLHSSQLLLLPLLCNRRSYSRQQQTLIREMHVRSASLALCRPQLKSAVASKTYRWTQRGTERWLILTPQSFFVQLYSRTVALLDNFHFSSLYSTRF